MSVAISYRGDFGKSGIGGSFFDHYSLRLQGCSSTTTAISPKESIGEFEEKIGRAPFKFSQSCLEGDEEKNGKIYPRGVSSVEQVIRKTGLLFVPGMSREESKNLNLERVNWEVELIKKACLHGKPVLVVCGGLERLFLTHGVWSQDVSGHNCRRGMPHIGVGGDIVGNTEGHSIDFVKDCMLGSLTCGRRASERVLGGESNSPQKWKFSWSCPLFPIRVTSVHWKMPSSILPECFEECARAIPEGCVPASIEAFESKHGAPVVYTAYHPEASGPFDLSAKLICFMDEAGKAYLRRKDVVRELDGRHEFDREFEAMNQMVGGLSL